MRFEDMIRMNLASGWRGHLPGSDTLADAEEWLAWRLDMRRNPPPQPYVYKGSDGRWQMISERRVADGLRERLGEVYAGIDRSDAALRKRVTYCSLGLLIVAALSRIAFTGAASDAGASPFDRLRAQSEAGASTGPTSKRRKLFTRHGLKRRSDARTDEPFRVNPETAD